MLPDAQGNQTKSAAAENDAGAEIMGNELAPRSSVQVGLAGIGPQTAQVSMLQEFGGAPGAGGKKDKLVDLDKIKRERAAAPLPGQTSFDSTEPDEDLLRDLDQLEARIETIQDDIRSHPLRKLSELVTASGRDRGHLVGLTPLQHKDIIGRYPPPAALVAGKVPWDYALDRIIEEKGYRGDRMDEFREEIERVYWMKQELPQLRDQRDALVARINKELTEAPAAQVSKYGDECSQFKGDPDAADCKVESHSIGDQVFQMRRQYPYWDLIQNGRVVGRVRYAVDARSVIKGAVRSYVRQEQAVREVLKPRKVTRRRRDRGAPRAARVRRARS